MQLTSKPRNSPVPDEVVDKQSPAISQITDIEPSATWLTPKNLNFRYSNGLNCHEEGDPAVTAVDLAWEKMKHKPSF